MLSEFKYTLDPLADIPKMFIDKEIGGKDAEGNPNIDGSQFMNELLCLSDQMGKKNIEVWINSPGGIVTEGMKIYNGILISKAAVSTHCYGIAASIAGVIFQAGSRRCMMDFATLMYHPAFNSDGTRDKGLDAMNEAICKMVARRTGKTEDEVWKIMNRGDKDDKGTWISAEEAKTNGFCDEVEDSANLNTKKIKALTDLTSIWKAANTVLNRAQDAPIKPKQMKSVCNKLGLVEDANEASVISAIENLKAQNKKSLEDMKKDYDDLKKKKDDMEDDMKKMKKEMDDLKKAKAEDEDKAKNKKKDDDEAKAEEDVKNLVKDGKIKNDAAIIKEYKALAIENPDRFKALTASLTSNGKAPNFNPNLPEAYKAMDEVANAAAIEAERMGIKKYSAAWYNHMKASKLNKTK